MRIQWLVIAFLVLVVPISAQFIASSGVTITPATPDAGQETTLTVNGWTYVYNQVYRWNPAASQWQLAGSLDGKQAGWADLSQAGLKFPASTSTLAIFACNPVSLTRFDCNGNVDIDQAGNVISNNAKWMLFRVTTQTTSSTCTDSDGGKIYDVKGTVGSSSDSCTTNVLTEHYCDNGQPANENTVCPYGCFDGACAKTHLVKFYLEPTLIDPAIAPPNLAPDPIKLALTKSRLEKYVSDVNFVLAKNTNRRLIFDSDRSIVPFWHSRCVDTPCAAGHCQFKGGKICKPSTGPIPASPTTCTADADCAGGQCVYDQVCRPHTNSGSPPAPTENFEIWADIVRSTTGYTFGGNGGVDLSNAGVLWNMKWPTLYDPDTLDEAQAQDYWKQINVLLHESGHILEVGVSEYYNLATVNDATGIAPIQNIRRVDPADPYWSVRKEYFADPMTANVMFDGAVPYDQRPKTRAEALAATRFAPLSAALMSGSYRGKSLETLPDMKNIRVKVVDAQGTPVPAADVVVY